MYHKILVPLDGSKEAEAALPLAGKLARIYNAEIILLRVAEYPFEMYSRCDSNTLAYPSPGDEKLQIEKEAVCKEAEDYLKRLAEIIEMTVSQVSIKVRESPVVDAILSTTENLDIDLIVMSTVGQGHSPWMIGAVANRILRESRVPVVLIGKESCSSLLDRSRSQSVSKQNEVMIQPETLQYESFESTPSTP
jgi:nucleotide-binding universal stress UspA family protein